MNEITQITVYVIWNKIRANIQFPPPCVTCMFTFIEKKNQKKKRKKNQQNKQLVGTHT